MKENSLYDKKSLRTVVGKTADFSELAKDCVAFSNAQGGVIDIGIENNDILPPASQLVPEELPTMVVNKITGMTYAVIATTEKVTAENGGEYIKLAIQRNPSAIAVTSSGKIYVRIGDNSVPVGSEDVARLAAERFLFPMSRASLCITTSTSRRLLLTSVEPLLTMSKMASARPMPGLISTLPVMTCISAWI